MLVPRAQSGTGKTATFSIACLQMIDTQLRDTQALILSPTRELAQQIQKVCPSAFLRLYVSTISMFCIITFFMVENNLLVPFTMILFLMPRNTDKSLMVRPCFVAPSTVQFSSPGDPGVG